MNVYLQQKVLCLKLEVVKLKWIVFLELLLLHLIIIMMTLLLNHQRTTRITTKIKIKTF